MEIPSLEKLKKYTTIEVLGTSEEKLQKNLFAENDNEVKFIPPLFEQYVIKVDNTDMCREAIKELIVERKLKISNTDKDIDKYIAKNQSLRYVYWLVRWKSETNFSVIVYSENKKRLHIDINYEYDEHGKRNIAVNSETLSGEFDRIYSKKKNELEKMCLGITLSVMAISDYLLNYSEKVKYVDVEKAKKNSVSQNRKHTKQSSTNSIYLKSEIKRYVVTGEEIENYKKKKYQLVKNSWYVRGYYQRYGKEKKPKYIPPRINRRNKNIDDTPEAMRYKVDA